MNRPRTLIPVLVLLAGAAWATACGDGATEPPPVDPPRATTVVVTPAEIELTALGETLRLIAQVRDQNGQAMAGAPVVWSSGDASVATVDATGLATAAGNGTATITATSGAASGSASVTVAQAVSAVAVSPATHTLVVGDTLRLAAAATDANGHPVAGTTFVWASGDTAVVTVDDAGLVTGVGAGEVEITAAAEGVAGAAQLAVVAPPDFFGQVLIPIDMRPRTRAVPVGSVSVTIVSGPRTGERVETNQSGRYVFPEMEEDELHVRLEKEKYETKEAIVHRRKATTLTDRMPLQYGGPQDRPGTVLIGREWPEYSKQVMDTMLVVPDLLLIETGTQTRYGGSYGWGVVVADDPEEPNPSNSPVMHEICHAHQHGVVRPRGGGTGSGRDWWPGWFSSPEARAYLEAREADREEIGHNPISTIPGDPWNGSNLSIIEENANFCAFWWGVGNDRYDIGYWRRWLREAAPNRTEWLETWLYS